MKIIKIINSGKKMKIMKINSKNLQNSGKKMKKNENIFCTTFCTVLSFFSEHIRYRPAFFIFKNKKSKKF